MPHIGIGQLQYRQQFEDQNGNVIRQVGYDNNNPINEKGGGILFRKVVFTIPMGAELNFRLGQHWGIYLDYTASRVDSRTLDGKIDGDKRDWFTSFNLGAVYKLNNASKRDSAKYNNWFLTLDGGAAWLYGDNTKSLDDVKGNLNIGVGYFFGNCWSVYAKFGYGILEGAQVWQDNVILKSFIQTIMLQISTCRWTLSTVSSVIKKIVFSDCLLTSVMVRFNIEQKLLPVMSI